MLDKAPLWWLLSFVSFLGVIDAAIYWRVWHIAQAHGQIQVLSALRCAADQPSGNSGSAHSWNLAFVYFLMIKSLKTPQSCLSVDG